MELTYLIDLIINLFAALIINVARLMDLTFYIISLIILDDLFGINLIVVIDLNDLISLIELIHLIELLDHIYTIYLSGLTNLTDRIDLIDPIDLTKKNTLMPLVIFIVKNILNNW